MGGSRGQVNKPRLKSLNKKQQADKRRDKKEQWLHVNLPDRFTRKIKSHLEKLMKKKKGGRAG